MPRQFAVAVIGFGGLAGTLHSQSGANRPDLRYLHAATLTAVVDTIDTYTSARDLHIEKGNGAWIVHVVRAVDDRRFEISDTWYDASGHVTAVQTTRTASGSLRTELETVRATTDSASMIVAADRVTGWVVPIGKPAQLFDGATTGERFSAIAVQAAIAKAKPAIGSTYMAPTYSLFGGDPVASELQPTRVIRRDTLYRRSAAIPVLVLENQGGTQAWVDAATGVEMLSRGNAGPTRWWWHISRGVRLPGAS